jgi:hypothetical protein
MARKSRERLCDVSMARKISWNGIIIIDVRAAVAGLARTRQMSPVP